MANVKKQIEKILSDGEKMLRSGTVMDNPELTRSVVKLATLYKAESVKQQDLREQVEQNTKDIQQLKKVSNARPYPKECREVMELMINKISTVSFPACDYYMSYRLVCALGIVAGMLELRKTQCFEYPTKLKLNIWYQDWHNKTSVAHNIITTAMIEFYNPTKRKTRYEKFKFSFAGLIHNEKNGKLSADTIAEIVYELSKEIKRNTKQ